MSPFDYYGDKDMDKKQELKYFWKLFIQQYHYIYKFDKSKYHYLEYKEPKCYGYIYFRCSLRDTETVSTNDFYDK